MKRIKELARRWDKIERKIRILRLVQKTLLRPEMKEFIFETDWETEEEMHAWYHLEDHLKIRELVQVLIDLEENRQGLLSYLSDGPRSKPLLWFPTNGKMASPSPDQLSQRMSNAPTEK